MKLELQLTAICNSLVELSPFSGGKEEAPQAYYQYVEEADDVANKVSRRMRLGMKYFRKGATLRLP